MVCYTAAIAECPMSIDCLRDNIFHVLSPSCQESVVALKRYYGSLARINKTDFLLK
jgi:hypothetical protein